MVKEGMIASTVAASMVGRGIKPELVTRDHRGRSTLRWVNRYSVGRLPWHWPRAGRFDLVLGLLASR